jgi:putative transposase
VSVARFIADQRTNYRVPQTVTCALLGVSTSWFYLASLTKAER